MREALRKRLQLRIKYTLHRSLFRRCFEDLRQRPSGPDAIFIWIPKTAGTSLLEAFSPYHCHRFKSVLRARYHWNRRGFVTFGHQSVSTLLKVGIIPQSFFDRAYRFAIVRHPQTRAQSLFQYLRHKKVLPPATSFSAFLEIIAENRPIGTLSRYEQRWIDTEGDSLRFHEGANPPPGCFNTIALSQCRPQTAWIGLELDGLEPKNRYLTHRLARIESLSRDIRDIARDLGLPPITLPRRNTSKTLPPAITPEDRRRIETYYQDDYEHLDY